MAKDVDLDIGLSPTVGVGTEQPGTGQVLGGGEFSHVNLSGGRHHLHIEFRAPLHGNVARLECHVNGCNQRQRQIFRFFRLKPLQKIDGQANVATAALGQQNRPASHAAGKLAAEFLQRSTVHPLDRDGVGRVGGQLDDELANASLLDQEIDLVVRFETVGQHG